MTQKVCQLFLNQEYTMYYAYYICTHQKISFKPISLSARSQQCSVKLSSPFRTNERPCNKFRFKIDFLDLFTVVLMLQSHEIENYAHPDKRLFKLSPKVQIPSTTNSTKRGLERFPLGRGVSSCILSWGRVKCKWQGWIAQEHHLLCQSIGLLFIVLDIYNFGQAVILLLYKIFLSFYLPYIIKIVFFFLNYLKMCTIIYY